MKILLMLLMYLSLQADGFNYSFNSISYIGIFGLNVIDYGEYKDTVYYSSIQANLDYDYKGIHIQATPFAYGYDSTLGVPLQNPNLYEPYDNTEIFFRSLYISIDLDYLTIGAGVLPFSNSTPTKYSTANYIQDGEGINMINDSSLTSVFGLVSTENSRTIFGVGTLDDILVPLGTYLDESLTEGQYTIFFINEYKWDKFILTSQIMWNYMTYYGDHITSVGIAGSNLVWDDSDESGLSLYGSLAASIYDNNNKSSKEKILDEYEIPGYVVDMYPDNFTFDNKTYYGASSLLGLRQDFDFRKKEFFINIEWFHTYGDWSSGNQGNMYNTKNNQMFNIRNNSYFANLTYVIDSSNSLGVSYTYMQFEESGTIGAPAVTIPTKDYLGIQLVDFTITRFIYRLNF